MYIESMQKWAICFGQRHHLGFEYPERRHTMKYLVYICTTALLTGACSLSPGTVAQQGSLRMQVSWPETGFRLQAIPAATQRLELQVSGSGLSTPTQQSLERDAGRLEMTLPVGPKRVRVRALSGNGEILAEAEAQVQIRPGQLTQAEMDLQPLKPEQEPPLASEGSGTGSGNTTPNTAPNPATDEIPSGPDSSGDSPSSDSAEPTDISSPQPSATPIPSGGSGGGGGGGSGSSSTTSPEVSALTASPSELSGLGFLTTLTATVSDPGQVLQANHYSWTCTDSAAQSGCGEFTLNAAEPHKAFWRASVTNGGVYTLKVEINTGSHTPTSATVQVTVPTGTGSLELNNGAFDGGQAGNEI